MRFEAIVNEYAVTLIARAACKWQSDEIAEASRRHHILIWKEAIVGFEADLGAALHCLRYERCTEPTCLTRCNELRKENPNMSALP